MKRAIEHSSSGRVRLGLLWLGVTGLCSLGCEDPLTDPAVIAGPRIIGARIATPADASAAQPRAGQDASIDWLVLSDLPGAYGARVAWCVGSPSVLGAPACNGGTFAESLAQGSYGQPLSLGFSLPGELQPGDTWLVWLGICTDAGQGAGEATFDAQTSSFSCASGDVLSGFYRGFIPEGTPNQNPALGDDTLLLGGEPWPVTPFGQAGALEPGAPCRDLALPSLSAAAASSLAFELGGDDREPLPVEPGDYAAHERESLVYTHLASRPGLERAFSAIDYDAERLGFDLPFDFAAAEPASPDGETVSLYLLVRDERGGVDWQRRDACLLPP